MWIEMLWSGWSSLYFMNFDMISAQRKIHFQMMFCFPSNVIFLELIDSYQLFCDFWKFPYLHFPICELQILDTHSFCESNLSLIQPWRLFWPLF